MEQRLKEVEEVAIGLIKEHLPEYSFGFNDKKRTLGICYGGRKRIELSKHYVLNYNDDLIIDTILHEIAHGLTLGDGHGAKWKAMCRKLGCKPERCKSLEEYFGHSWELHCEKGCCKIPRYRKPNPRTIARYKSAHCKTKLSIVPISTRGQVIGQNC